MSAHAAAVHDTAHQPTTKLFVTVWVTLVAVTFAEVYLAYLHFNAVTMLLLLLGLSIMKAGLIMAYFMHLRYERLGLVLLLIPVTIFCVGMMTVVFPDSLRLLHFRLLP
jgi:cytochrome c oxidase subunit 4